MAESAQEAAGADRGVDWSSHGIREIFSNCVVKVLSGAQSQRSAKRGRVICLPA